MKTITVPFDNLVHKILCPETSSDHDKLLHLEKLLPPITAGKLGEIRDDQIYCLSPAHSAHERDGGVLHIYHRQSAR